ncbi:hypothetical protein HKD37_16G045662 [Glycine soja]
MSKRPFFKAYMLRTATVEDTSSTTSFSLIVKSMRTSLIFAMLFATYCSSLACFAACNLAYAFVSLVAFILTASASTLHVVAQCDP